MKKSQVLISFIGTDGSGKTTTSALLADKLMPLGAEMVWCGAESYLMRPIRSVLKFFRYHQASADSNSTTYRSEISEKNSLAKRWKPLQRLYISLVMLDYNIQYRVRMFKYRHANFLILDRYFYDVAVNLAITLGWSPNALVAFISKNHHRYRLPDIRAFVYVSPEISMSRKDDIPDVDYVKLRLNYYHAIAKQYGYKQYDGCGDINKNVESLFNLANISRNTRHVHYIHSNNNDVGGADYCLERTVCEINKSMGFSCSVSLRLDTPIVSIYQQDHIPVFLSNFIRPQLSQGLWPIIIFPIVALRDLLFFYRFFRRHKIDIVHVNDLYDVIPALAAKLRGIPCLYHIRMIRINVFEARIFSWLVKTIATRSLSVSHAVRNHYFPEPDKNQLVLYDWPNDKFIVEPSTDIAIPEFFKYKAIVVFIARIEYWKGQHVFLNAIKELGNSHPDTGFFLIGGHVEGEKKLAYAEAIRDQCENLDVNYLGERKDIDQLLNAANIAIHASITPDPFPGTVLEGQLSKAVMIGANAGGVPEMISHEENGFLYTPGSATELSRRIDFALKDLSKIKKISARGRNHILTLTDKRKLINKLVNVYRSLS